MDIKFVEDVMRRGAVGIISESEAPENFEGVWLQVANARVALAQAAAVINGNPSHKLKLVGITGTNGKTTTTYLTYTLAEANGEKGAMLTTVEYRIGENIESAIRTTPEASDTQRFLNEALKRVAQWQPWKLLRKRLIYIVAMPCVFKWRFLPI